MAILEFNEPELRKELDGLPKQLRAAFAAACAQRQYPNYVKFAQRVRNGDANVLARILEELWNAIEGGATKSSLQKELDLCMSLFPNDEQQAMSGAAQADNAVASTAYAIRTQLTGDTQEAAWAARRACDALDAYIVSHLNRGIIDRALERRIASHPLIQSELGRQRRDLVELGVKIKHEGDNQALISEFRRRAEQELIELP